jgi:hypothetical protein
MEFQPRRYDSGHLVGLMRRHAFAALLALQTTGAHPPADPFAFFRPTVVLGEEDRRRLDRGEIVARTLDSADREVTVFAAVGVAVDGDRLVAWMRRIEALKKSPYVLAIGRFSDPPRLRDLDGLALDDEDLLGIRECRPGDCALKLSPAEMTRLQTAAAEGGSDWKPAVQQAFRRLVLERVETYLQKGQGALEPYADQRTPTKLAERFGALVARSPYLTERVPQLAAHLNQYPGSVMHGVESFVYWSKERLERSPIISATHVNILRGSDAQLPDTLVAGKGIFATHYVNASLGLTAIVRGASGTTNYLVYLNRSDIDVPRGILSGVVRWAVQRRVRAEAAAVLRGLRDRLTSGEPPAVAAIGRP